MGTLLSLFAIRPFRIGGQEAFARELSCQLGQHGWQSVQCFSSEPPDAVRRFLELPNVSLEALPNAEQASWQSVTGLVRILRRYRPTLLHLHYTGFLGPYPWLARLVSAKKVFFTDHSSRPAGFVPRRAPAWKRWITRALNFPLSRVVCVSDYGYRCATGLGLLPTERFARVYNGVSLEQMSGEPETASLFRRKYSIPENRPLIVQVSWIIPEKGVLDLLEAARIVLGQNPDAHFAMVGEGAYRQQYTERSREMGLDKNVTWTGAVEDPFGEGVYAAADVVCQLSRWEEVFGFVIAEAMAWQKPLVATRVGGIPELVEDGQSGFLVERENAAQAAEKILVLLNDKELRRKLGARGRQIAADKFDLRKNVAQLLELYGITPKQPGRSRPLVPGGSS